MTTGSEKRRESPDGGDEEVNKLTSIDGIHCYRRLHRKTEENSPEEEDEVIEKCCR